MNFDDIAGDLADSSGVIAETRPVVPGRCVHIDGDMLAYWAGGNESTTVEASRGILINKIKLFKEAAGAERIQLHLTGDGSTKGDRFLIATTKPYQGQRAGAKPKNWRYLRQYMEDASGKLFTTKTWFDREADDGFGYISSCLPNDVIATRDKDMRMLPIRQLVWETLDVVDVTADPFCLEHGGLVYGRKWFWLQMLMGDGADNIPGLPTHPRGFRGKVGEKTAVSWLSLVESNKEAFEVVANLYREAYPFEWNELFAEQAMLLWMRRSKRAPADEFLDYLPVGGALYSAVSDATKTILQRVQGMKDEAAAIQAASLQGGEA